MLFLLLYIMYIMGMFIQLLREVVILCILRFVYQLQLIAINIVYIVHIRGLLLAKLGLVLETRVFGVTFYVMRKVSWMLMVVRSFEGSELFLSLSWSWRIVWRDLLDISLFKVVKKMVFFICICIYIILNHILIKILFPKLAPNLLLRISLHLLNLLWRIILKLIASTTTSIRRSVITFHLGKP